MRMLPAARRRLAALLVLLVGVAGLVAAEPLPPPRLSHAPTPALAGDVVVYRIAVDNPRDQPMTPQLYLTWPAQGYPIGFSGLQQAELDHESGQLRGVLELPPGARQTVELQVLTPRDAAGSRLSLTARLYETWSETDHWEHHTLDLDRRPDVAGVAVGALRVLPAGLVTLGWMVATLLLGIVLQRLATRRGAAARRVPGGIPGVALALMIPVGFWLIFVDMAWRDWRILTAWTPCEATVLGGRLIEEASSTHNGARRTSTSASSFRPELALRYAVDGATRYSTGYDSGSSLRIGGRTGSAGELASWRVGMQVPCWFDPQQPDDVVVERGFGGAYLFVLFTLPVFGIGLLLLRRLRAD